MNSAPNQSKFGNIKGLDSIRFFAFLFVFISHSVVFLSVLKNTKFEFMEPFLSLGDLGVSAFFILSGFLISSLLFTELSQRDKISVKAFYLRRILRIWPLYFLIIFVGVIIIPTIIGGEVFSSPITIHGTGQAWKLFTFTFNFGHTADFLGTSIILAVLWSLSVEEQFYIMWPWIVKYFGKNKILIILISTVIVSMIFRAMSYANPSIIEYHSLSVVGDIALGGILSYLYIYNKKYFVEILSKFTNKLFCSGIAMVILVILLRPEFRYTRTFITLEPVLFGLGVTAIITSIALGNKIFDSRIFVFLGKISFGLYMYHIIAMMCVLLISQRVFGLNKIIVVFLSFALTIILSYASYRFFEKPFLNLKNRLSTK